MKVQIDLDDAVKLRDYNQSLADTWNDIIEKNAPPRLSATPKNTTNLFGMKNGVPKESTIRPEKRQTATLSFSETCSKS